MSDSGVEEWKYIAIASMALLAAASLYVVPQQLTALLSSSSTGLPSAYGAGTLTNVRVSNTNNLFDTTSWYVVSFRTGSTDTIAKVEMTFPAGFDVSNVRRIENSGIPDGTMSVSGQTVIYTVGSPISIPANTLIKIMMERIVNGDTASNMVAVATRNAGGMIIDGPTNSASFDLTGCIDSNTLCIDPIRDRVGIGTDSPLSKLTLVGDLELLETGSGLICEECVGLEDTNFIRAGVKADGSDGWNPDNSLKDFAVTSAGSTIISTSRVPLTLGQPDASRVPTVCGVYDASTTGGGTIYIHCDIAPPDGTVLRYVVINSAAATS